MNEERDAEIVRLRENGLTLQEIADRYGLTRERVRQIVERGGSVVLRTKDGSIDRRSKAYRERGAVLAAHEIEQMIRLVVPTMKSAGGRMEQAARAITEFWEQHPEEAAELERLQREFNDAMQANNEAFLPLQGLLNKLLDSGEHERWQQWCDHLNGKGPHPDEIRQEDAAA